MKKLDNKAQGSSLMYMLLFIMLMFLFISTGIGRYLGEWFGYVLQPVIGFGGKYPVLTIILAGVFVVLISGLLTNFFTDWKKMGAAQQTQKAFQKELQKARREGNTNRVNKLMKMQPEIFKKQQEASSGSMKSMLFLFIFIWPIFIWLRSFLGSLDHYHFTVPWASGVSLIPGGEEKFIMQTWLWLYLIFSVVIGQIIRLGLKYISWSDWWKNIKSRIRPSPR